MTINLTDPANHPANRPLTGERIERVIEALESSLKYRNGSTLDHFIADAVKGMRELRDSREAVPAVLGDLLSMAASAIEDLLEHTDPHTSYYSGVWADVPGKLRAAALQESSKCAGAPQNCRSNENAQVLNRQSVDHVDGVTAPPITRIKPVADLYEVTVPSGRSTTFTTDAAEAKDCADMGWKVQEYVTLEHYQEAVTGNSLATPDGWVMVPIVPTIEMLDEFDSIIDYGAEDSNDAWSRLISVAPKEVG